MIDAYILRTRVHNHQLEHRLVAKRPGPSLGTYILTGADANAVMLLGYHQAFLYAMPFSRSDMHKSLPSLGRLSLIQVIQQQLKSFLFQAAGQHPY
jgi:hypothetical protein